MTDEDITAKLFEDYKKLPAEVQEFEDFRAKAETRKLIGEIHTTLTGNGHPKEGHIFRLGILEKEMKVIIGVATGIASAVITKIMKLW